MAGSGLGNEIIFDFVLEVARSHFVSGADVTDRIVGTKVCIQLFLAGEGIGNGFEINGKPAIKVAVVSF